MKYTELLEATQAVTGRKYQHIEDLVFTNGSLGGLHAVERLRSMIEQKNTLELKWDGSPVIYYGKDSDGTFRMIPKNAWDYIKRGKKELDNGAPTVMSSPKDIEMFILNTGKIQPGKEAERMDYAKSLSSLWPYFEQISPDFGYIEGGLLFYPGKPAILNSETNEYDFTPNITSFHIPAESKLGRRIENATMMVAATGYYEYLGSSDETRFPDAASLSTTDVIVQGTTYIENLPEIKTPRLDKVEQFIETHGEAIDSFLAPKPGLSKPGDILYKFYNQNLRIPGVQHKFETWARENLSATQQDRVLNDPGLAYVLMAVSLLSEIKLQIVRKLGAGTYQDIRQTKPEGYVQAHPGTKFKNDLPGQYIKAIDQEVWSPRKDVAEDFSMSLFENISRTGESNTAVVGWGRGMGHRGHMFLASSVITQAKQSGGDPYFVVSRVVGKDDPITPQEKLAIYKKVFPGHKNIFQTATDEMPDLTRVLHHLNMQGYRNVIVVVGEDQKDSFQYVVQSNGKPNKTGQIPFNFDSIRVMSRQETSDESREEEGPRATPMREVLLDPLKTEQEKFKVWRSSMSPQISDEEVMDLMTKAQERLIAARVKKPRAKKKVNEATEYGDMKFYTSGDQDKIHKLTKPKNITPGQRKSLQGYTGSSSKEWNSALHNSRKKNKELSEPNSKSISNIDDTLKANPLEGPVQVFTGVPESIQKTYKHYGADPSLPINLILPAYTSTSTKFRIATLFAKWTTINMDELVFSNKDNVPANYLQGKRNLRNVIKLLLPKGFNAVSVKNLSKYDHENEILMARDTMIQVSPNPTFVMQHDTPVLVWHAKILTPEKKVNEAKLPIPKLFAHKNDRIHRDNTPKLPDDHPKLKSIRNYTSASGGIADRLHKLRRNEPIEYDNLDHAKVIDDLDDVLDTHRLLEPVTVFHGTREPITSTYKHYNANTDMPINLILPAFTSTTTTFDKSLIFGAPEFTDTSWVVPRNRDKFKNKQVIARHVIMMRLPKGFNAASVKKHSEYPNENEILMARNTMIQIDPHPTFYVGDYEHIGIFIWHAKILK